MNLEQEGEADENRQLDPESTPEHFREYLFNNNNQDLKDSLDM